MRSLWLKLMGAFALVILIGGVVDALLVSQATSGQFSQYVTQSGQAWAQQLAPTFASLLRAHWQLARGRGVARHFDVADGDAESNRRRDDGRHDGPRAELGYGS